ncbi:MAG: alanine racemase [Nocardioidaceae bacterium]
MPLTLYVDGARWDEHLEQVRDAHPGLVPVIKGNGYGFGLRRLAGRAAWLGVDTVAVGMYGEVAAVAEELRTEPGRSVMVLTPWRPFERRAVLAPHVIHTVGRLEDLRALSSAAAEQEPPRVVLERLTSMRRHGFSARDLREAATLLEGVHVEGVAMHLPIAGSHLAEVRRLMTDVVAAGLPTRRVFVSHLTDAEMGSLRQSFPDYELRPRIGTALWLGDREALRVGATVLDVHPVERGDVFGYRGRRVPAAGTIVVVSGGTAHGIGLEAPTGGATLRDRAARIAQGGLDAAGWVRSPYTVDGRRRLFAEPPHMQASMLFLTRGVSVPEIGDELPVRVRLTTTSFDETVVSG